MAKLIELSDGLWVDHSAVTVVGIIKDDAGLPAVIVGVGGVALRIYLKDGMGAVEVARAIAEKINAARE